MELPNLTLRELVNYGRPLYAALPENNPDAGHSPTPLEKTENDSEDWGEEWRGSWRDCKDCPHAGERECCGGAI